MVVLILAHTARCHNYTEAYQHVEIQAKNEVRYSGLPSSLHTGVKYSSIATNVITDTIIMCKRQDQ